MAFAVNSPRSALCVATRLWSQDPRAARGLSLFFTVAPQAGTLQEGWDPLTALASPSCCPPANNHPKPTSPLLHTSLQRHQGIHGDLSPSKHADLHLIKHKAGRETTSSPVLLQCSSPPFCNSFARLPSPFIAPFTPVSFSGRRGACLKKPLCPYVQLQAEEQQFLPFASRYLADTGFAALVLGRT